MFSAKIQPQIKKQNIFQSSRRVQRQSLTVKAQKQGSSILKIFVPPHPLVKHYLALARNETTPPIVFRQSIAELSKFLTYDCSRSFLPTSEISFKTPMQEDCLGELVDPTQPIHLVPILRAGIGMESCVQNIIPHSITHYFGAKRNEETLKSEVYYCDFPTFTQDDKVIIYDIMISTGGTMIACIEKLLEKGVKMGNIRIISILTATPGLKLLSSKYKDMVIFCACIDEQLDKKGYILPGLGDAGDRSFGTGGEYQRFIGYEEQPAEDSQDSD